MSGPPGSGKSMLAARLPSILPPLTPRELLEVSMIHSVAGELAGGALTNARPFRAPHHNASTAALIGGGAQARPGEVSLAHNGVLFLDEFPEFQPQTLDSLRQPLEAGEVSIARANARVTYPARFQLIGAMNPCRCGHGTDPGYTCRRQQNERCIAAYQARISGPLLDRFDLSIDVPAVTAADLILPAPRRGRRMWPSGSPSPATCRPSATAPWAFPEWPPTRRRPPASSRMRRPSTPQASPCCGTWPSACACLRGAIIAC